MAEKQIFTVLADRLGTLVLSPTLPIAWPNVDFTPPPRTGVGKGAYLRASHIPTTTDQITLGDSGYNRHRGIFQIDVVWPANGGLVAPMKVVDAIIAHFQRGTVLTEGGHIVRIYAPPHPGPVISSPPQIQIPVSVRYQADAPNPS
ncbi:DUF4128 domain-containing protein [Acuticoccus sp. M5D2P5]|uniref:DUF4128 domain-containing protein n=1 Tax=Acuticoccus kalidii TaxID=2910977 RepID=UPI001F4274EC|nr:DUF4128 domain-containing protein [Acuticoccus kalidii]MCF3934347.1 DUF4128 domain-containing protein [Acuticoccus kalidii]